MKILGINASPRKNANTQTLVETVLNGAAEKGAETRMVHLRELKINGCLGCDGCKKQLGRCVQKDDLSTLLQEMTSYDAIVLGTPVYWVHVSGQFKIFVDRLYCFLDVGENAEAENETTTSTFPKGKKCVIITSRGDKEPPPPMISQFYDHLNEWLQMFRFILNAKSFELFHQYGAILDRNAAENDPELLANAKALGAGLVE